MSYVKKIPINMIKCHDLPLNKNGLNTAKNWHHCLYKPVKVIKQQNGVYRIKDGRHRYLAARLNGADYMVCKVLYHE